MTYNPDPYAEDRPEPEQAPRRLWPALVAGSVAIVLVVGGLWLAVVTGRDGSAEAMQVRTRLEIAEARCAEWSAYVNTGDEGRSLTVRNAGARQVDGADVEDLECILAEIDTPDAVLERIWATRALDGMQDAQWDGLDAVWNYHPDDGMTLIVSETR